MPRKLGDNRLRIQPVADPDDPLPWMAHFCRDGALYAGYGVTCMDALRNLERICDGDGVKMPEHGDRIAERDIEMITEHEE